RRGNGTPELFSRKNKKGKHRRRKKLLCWPSSCVTLAGAPTYTERCRPASRKNGTTTHTRIYRLRRFVLLSLTIIVSCPSRRRPIPTLKFQFIFVRLTAAIGMPGGFDEF
ncbi:unnamed protein product, partial [Sphacelaria rigidula]